MSLFSVDKSGSDRKNPSPNQNDVVNNRLAHNTTAITYRTDGNPNYQRVIFKNGLTISYDDQNRVIKIDGFEPRVVPYPFTLQAKYGFDVYIDILGIDPPTT